MLSTAVATAFATASIAFAQGDMTVHRMGYNPGNNANGFNSYGVDSGIAAYSVASQSCNIGNVDLTWTSGNGQSHPVISQNVYRLDSTGRRFEHIGQSWLKHGFCALCESGCGPGVGGGCASILRVGCADTYSSGLNDGSGGGPKFTVDPVSGDHLHPDPTPTGPATIRGRLQCDVTDVSPGGNNGAVYFVEGMYVHYEDHQNGFARNNATWREIQFANDANITMQSGSPVNHSTETIVEAWKSEDAAVTIVELENTDEGGPGIHGYFQIAYRIWDNGNGTWEYSYLVNNQNSTQGAYSFKLPSGGGLNLTNVWFNDVDYHSGEPQDGTDWNMTQGASDITWTCPQTFAQNPDANAINWCTGYSFGFTANAGPVAGTGELDLFEPGVGSTLVFPIEGPGAGGGGFTSPYCFGDASGILCPCFNHGGPGEGCEIASGTFSGCTLGSSGNLSEANDTFVLEATGAPTTVPGLFFSGSTQPGGGLGIPFGDGIQCAGGSIKRLQVVVTDGAGNASSSISISVREGSQAGDTRYYQYWFRNNGGPCGSGFNTSGGLAGTWGA